MNLTNKDFAELMKSWESYREENKAEDIPLDPAWLISIAIVHAAKMITAELAYIRQTLSYIHRTIDRK